MSPSDIKADFPLFKSHPQLVYLDSAATSLKPASVIDAVNDYYRTYSANVHRGLYDLSEQATARFEGAREIVREFIGAASSREIIFTRGTTEAINLVALSFGRHMLKKDDEIIVSILEHHSNIVPWQLLAKSIGCKIRWLMCDKKGRLTLNNFSKLLTRRTRLVALSHVSNALGTVTNLKPFIQKAHATSAHVLIDAAQSAPHMPLNVNYLDADFVAFSGHKMCGPTGIGVLYGKEKLLAALEPVFGGGDMIREVHTSHSTWNDLPWKFEAGTPPIAQAIGLAAALTYLKGIGLENICRHEQKLLDSAFQKLGKMPGVRLQGPCDSSEQSGVISFEVVGVHPHDVGSILNEDHIAIRAGHHCCMPLMEHLGLTATARMSFYLYTTEADIEAACRGIRKVQKIFHV